MASFDPFAEEYFDDPFPIFKRLRDEEPACYVEEYDCYFLSRFEDIWQAVSDPRFSHRLGTNSQDLLVGKPPHLALSSMVPPAHTELRKVLFPHFSPRSAAKLEARTRELVGDFLDEALERGGELDVNGDLGRKISARVAFLLIGLPIADADMAAAAVNTAFDRSKGVKGPTEAALAAQQGLHEYLHRAMEERRGSPGGDGLIDRLLDFRHEGRPLPDDQIVSNLYLMVVGGTETLPKVFAGGVYQLWRHPDQRARLAADPGLAPDAFWEILRYEMPTLMLGAASDEPAEICGGLKIPAGQRIMHLWVSANRDEREFPDPDRFDIQRKAPRILTFNHGRHRCLGAHIAQMEGRVLLQELLARAPEYEVVEEKVVRIRSEFFRGYSEMPIRLRPS